MQFIILFARCVVFQAVNPQGSELVFCLLFLYLSLRAGCNNLAGLRRGGKKRRHLLFCITCAGHSVYCAAPCARYWQKPVLSGGRGGRKGEEGRERGERGERWKRWGSLWKTKASVRTEHCLPYIQTMQHYCPTFNIYLTHPRLEFRDFHPISSTCVFEHCYIHLRFSSLADLLFSYLWTCRARSE